MSPDTYSARFRLPDLIERGQRNDLACEVYRDGALVAPASGTVVVRDASGATRTSGAVTIAGDVATCAWTPDAELALGEAWQVEWTLTLAGVVHVFRNEAALVRRRLYCPITDADLFRVEGGLDPASATPLTNLTDYQDKIDEAWTQVQLRLLERGDRPNLIIGASALRQVTLDLALALIMQDISSRITSQELQAAAIRYRGFYEADWERVQLTYDKTDQGAADRGRRGRAGGTWTGGWSGRRWGW